MSREPQVPEVCRTLELATVERALIKARGNVGQAAKALKVPSPALRKLVYFTSELADVMFEQYERAMDEAQAILFEGLRSERLSERLEAAKFLLTSDAGRRRGFGPRGRRSGN
jgi:hypothetical protein